MWFAAFTLLFFPLFSFIFCFFIFTFFRFGDVANWRQWCCHFLGWRWTGTSLVWVSGTGTGTVVVAFSGLGVEKGFYCMEYVLCMDKVQYSTTVSYPGQNIPEAIDIFREK